MREGERALRAVGGWLCCCSTPSDCAGEPHGALRSSAASPECPVAWTVSPHKARAAELWHFQDGSPCCCQRDGFGRAAVPSSVGSKQPLLGSRLLRRFSSDSQFAGERMRSCSQLETHERSVHSAAWIGCLCAVGSSCAKVSNSSAQVKVVLGSIVQSWRHRAVGAIRRRETPERF